MAGIIVAVDICVGYGRWFRAPVDLVMAAAHVVNEVDLQQLFSC